MKLTEFVSEICQSETSVLDKIDFIQPGQRRYQNELLDMFNEAVSSKDILMLDCLLIIAERDGLDDIYTEVLCSILQQEWHKSHEDIISLLEEIRDPKSVDCVYRATFLEKHNMDEEPAPLTIKCIWALAAINTKAAFEKIQILRASINVSIQEAAEAYLNKT